ncbi:MAG: OmpA family protein [Sulfuricaulis sp.]
MTRLTVLAIIAVLTAVTSGCVTDENSSRSARSVGQKDVAQGAIGSASNREAIIGVAGGGIAGAAVDSYMDSQMKDFEMALATEVQAGEITIQKINQKSLRITMTGQTTFDSGSTTIKPGFYATMDKIADVLLHYDKTLLVVIGHTDNLGSNQFNQALSQRRAKAVNDYLLNRGVLVQRLTYRGRGASSPLAPNATEAGRRLNRRVEIIIEPVVADPQNQTPG